MSSFSMHILRETYDPKKQIGIIRCNQKSVPKVVAGLGLISRIGDIRVTFKILKISGTIKSLGKT